MSRPEVASSAARLEAAAISLKMIAAQDSNVAPDVATVAHRFGIDEGRLRRAVRSRSTQRTYDRIHSNYPAGDQP